MSQLDSIDLGKIERDVEKAFSRSRGTRIQKLRIAPIKLLYSKILELITLHFRNPIKIKAKTFWNGDMFVIIPEPVSLSIYRYGFFEEGLTKMILEHLKPGMIFFDIGAHFGYFTLLGSLLVGKEGQVHSFEPTPSSFNILKSNASNIANVFQNNNAVLSKRKVVFINDYGIKYSAYNSIYDAKLPQNILKKLKVRKHEVEAVAIDDYADNKCVVPNFIKIDAESSEYEILLGMEKTIAKFHPMISIEVGDIRRDNFPGSRELINFLIGRGYQAYDFEDGRILRHSPKNEQYKYDNILFLPI